MPWITAFFRRRRANLRQYHVDLSDGTKRAFDLEPRTTISNLIEVSLLSMSVPGQHHEMFCVLSPTVVNLDDRRWLRPEKSLKRELKGVLLPLTLHVRVLYYPRDHYTVDHRIAKHLLYVQVKTDLQDGKLKCSNEVATQLAGLVAQAELGNYSEATLQESYMSQLNVINMSPRHERRAIEQHKIRSGLSMDECIDEFLSISETLNGYGTHKFDVHDDHDRPASLACGPLGVEVLMGTIQTVQFHWESITSINVHSRIINFQTESSYNQTGHLYSFRCFSSRLCKNIAVLCVNMRNYYCNSEVVRPTSKLKRLFSTRMSGQRSSRYLKRNSSAVSSFSTTRARPGRSAINSNSRSLRERRSHNSMPAMMPGQNQSATTKNSSRIPALHLHTSSNSSFTTPLMDTERDQSISPARTPESPVQVLPTLVETRELPVSHASTLSTNNEVPASKNKASTLPSNMNPAEIMNFNYLGNRSHDPAHNSTYIGNSSHDPAHSSTYIGNSSHDSAHNSTYIGNSRHDSTHSPTHNSAYTSINGRSQENNYNFVIDKPSSGRRQNGHTHHYKNGIVDNNFDCINELLEEAGLESSQNMRKRERISVGSEIDRRKIFPVDNSYYRNRSHTLHNLHKKTNERRSSTSSSRPLHQSTSSDPSRSYFSSTSSLNSSNVGVASMAYQMSLATLSQDSSYNIDPHIRSLVFGSSSQADTTEL